jgi:ABC-type antimicrobial peptide transport system permease subunit
MFGMAAFTAERRTKEIGVRKVLGASVLNLWSLLSAEFLKLVLFSLVIAIPAAYLVMHSWLQNFNYRTSMNWWVFVLTALAALGITLVTVSYQSIKTALVNPVKSLRSE